ncbi:MAG: hypothetical protein KJ607_00305, partial [Bacteroidetes bacterium]|nr:hypothetical protein [Bacteroidota bacterium]
MNKSLFFSAFLAMFLYSFICKTQPDTTSYPYWMEMIYKKNANLIETRRAFEQYFANKEFTKGYKLFLRWEWYNSTLMKSDGSLPDFNAEYERFKNFLANSPPPTIDYTADWYEIGPSMVPQNKPLHIEGIGRLNCIGFHPTEPNTIYVGSPFSGLWKSTDNGSSWILITKEDFWSPAVGVSSIAIDPSNPDIIYIGTGDRDNLWNIRAAGVMKTNDGGETWTMINNGMVDDNNDPVNPVVSKILIHPTMNNVIFAATYYGLYKSTDGGAHWVKKLNNYIHDLEFNPGNYIIYGTGYGGNHNEKFYRSTDMGENWMPITDGISQNIGRAEIAVNNNNTHYVYCMVREEGAGMDAFYKSTDDGLSFMEITDIPNLVHSQSMYNQVLVTDPEDENILYGGGIDLWKSEDGGVSWVKITKWNSDLDATALHADKHDLKVNPISGYLYCAHDGGIGYSMDNGQSWIDISNGLGVGEIYHLGQHPDKQKVVIGGFQDCGTNYYDYGTWFNVDGGDGGQSLIIGEQPYNKFYLANWELKRNGVTILPDNFGASIQMKSSVLRWHKSDPDVLFFGVYGLLRGRNVYSSSCTWEYMSDNIKYVTAMDQSPVNDDIFYYACKSVSNSIAQIKMYRTLNINTAPGTMPVWDDITDPVFDPDYPYPSAIVAHPNYENIVYLAAGPHVYMSTDNGSIGSWSDISYNLPVIGITCMVMDKNTEALYIGTSYGVFCKKFGIDEWDLYGDNLPSIKITDMDIFYNETDPTKSGIRISTYGRGIWGTGIRYACDYNEANPISITGSETWNTERYINSDVYIDPGAVLTITKDVYMPPESSIHVEIGGKLVIDGAKITNNCNGTMWKGITVWGDKAASMYPDQYPGVVQGRVELKNGATIENAVTGIYAINGGVILANDSKFHNNQVCVDFNKKIISLPFSDFPDDHSYFHLCEFLHDGCLNDPVRKFKGFVTMHFVDGVEFRGCSFTDRTEPVYHKMETAATGIYSDGCDFSVTAVCTVPPPNIEDPCDENNLVKNEFYGLKYGIKAVSSVLRNARVYVNKAHFERHFGSILLEGCDYAIITENIFEGNFGGYPETTPPEPATLTTGNYGVYLNGCNAYKIEENSFSSGIIGILVNNSWISDNEVYKNKE